MFATAWCHAPIGSMQLEILIAERIAYGRRKERACRLQARGNRLTARHASSRRWQSTEEKCVDALTACCGGRMRASSAQQQHHAGDDREQHHEYAQRALIDAMMNEAAEQ